MYFTYFSQQIAEFSIYCINWSLFIPSKVCVYCKQRFEYLCIVRDIPVSSPFTSRNKWRISVRVLLNFAKYFYDYSLLNFVPKSNSDSTLLQHREAWFGMRLQNVSVATSMQVYWLLWPTLKVRSSTRSRYLTATPRKIIGTVVTHPLVTPCPVWEKRKFVLKQKAGPYYPNPVW